DPSFQHTAAVDVQLGVLTGDDPAAQSGGAPVDANGTCANGSSPPLTLPAARPTGTALAPLDPQIGSSTATTPAGGVFVTAADGATPASITAGGASDVAITTTAGSLTVGAIDATGAAVTLAAAAGSILDDADGTDVTAASATLT